MAVAHSALNRTCGFVFLLQRTKRQRRRVGRATVRAGGEGAGDMIPRFHSGTHSTHGYQDENKPDNMAGDGAEAPELSPLAVELFAVGD